MAVDQLLHNMRCFVEEQEKDDSNNIAREYPRRMKVQVLIEPCIGACGPTLEDKGPLGTAVVDLVGAAWDLDILCIEDPHTPHIDLLREGVIELVPHGCPSDSNKGLVEDRD
jgi:hypothetical protein